MEKLPSYLHTIKKACPELKITSTRVHTAEGQYHDIIIVNDDLIFRFPRYAESIPYFLQEVELLQKLQGHLSLPTPKPVYVSVGKPSVGRVFMGYKMLPGKPLFSNVLNAITDRKTIETFARQLAEFLYQLHNLSPSSLLMELEVQNQNEENKTLYKDIQEHLFCFMRSDARISVVAHFEEYLNDASLHEYAPSVIHGDFGGSNILFEGHKITGIIDFGFAGYDDPARDIAAISTLGDSFFGRVCEYYPNITLMLRRAKFYRGTYALYEALHGFRNDDKNAFDHGMEQYV